MKIYVVTYLSETENLNFADAFPFSTLEEAKNFLETDAKECKEEYEERSGDTLNEVKRTSTLLTLGGGYDNYITWEIKEKELEIK